MSVFRGSISEYPGVIVDHFIPANCEKGRIFFLSHCHKDHMTGLGSPNIIAALKKWSTSLLCSEVTRSLLTMDPEFSRLAPHLTGLPMEEPVAMTTELYNDVQEKLSFTVTLLPAGHCPGSSMFLFQGSKGNVLYTGDFRLTLEETGRLRPLHCGGSLLDISALYVDTTFCHPIASEIPSRETSRDLILKLIERWLAKEPTNVVHLQCGMFGYEHVFMGVYKKFKTKIHIAPWKMNAYREISAVTDCLTTNGESTQIHTCNYRKGQKGQPGLPCGSCWVNGAPPNVLRIKPSTQWFLFNNQASAHPCVFVPQFNKFRVIHSMHASYRELRDFITYIKPKRIVPCVIPSGDRSLSDVCARLKGLLPQAEVSSTYMYVDPKQVKEKRQVSLKKSARDTAVSSQSSDSNDSWSTGDESIDEFTSTGEQTPLEERDAFTHTQSHGNQPSLPSLIHGAIEDDKSSPPPSAESGATVGSLKQSPIDLSLNCTPPSESATQNTTSHHPTSSNTTTTTEINSSQVSNITPKEEDVTRNEIQYKKEEESKEAGNAWCLKFECSPSDACVGCTPPSKKPRLTETISRKLFKDRFRAELGQQEEAQSLDSHSVIDLTQDEATPEEQLTYYSDSPPQLIDLTHDHLTSTPDPTNDKDATLTEETLYRTSETQYHTPEQMSSRCTAIDTDILRHNIMTTRLSSPIELSDSQTTSGSVVGSQGSASVESGLSCDPFGSPNCLPPTPGRENIHSILQRPQFP